MTRDVEKTQTAIQSKCYGRVTFSLASFIFVCICVCVCASVCLLQSCYKQIKCPMFLLLNFIGVDWHC